MLLSDQRFSFMGLYPDADRTAVGYGTGDQDTRPLYGPLFRAFSSLRIKTALIIFATSVALTIVMALTSQALMLGGFTALEEQAMQENLARAKNAITEDLSKLDTIAFTWAEADDTGRFMGDRDASYLRSNFPDETFVGSDFNLFMITDADGELVWHKYVNLVYEHEMPTPKSLLEQVPTLSPATGSEAVSGILMLSSGPMMIASRPVMAGDSGEVSGRVTVGRFLDQVEIARLSRQTALSLSINELALPSGISDVGERLVSGGGAGVVLTEGDDQIAGYALLCDVMGAPALLLEIDAPRDIYREGQNAVHYVIIAILLIGGVFSALMILLLQKTFISRLEILGGRIAGIGKGGDLSARLDVDGEDEIATVAASVNGMLASLENARSLLDESRERYSRVINEAKEIIFTLDLEGNLTSVNRVAEDLTGRSRDDLIGRPVREFIAPAYLHLIEGSLTGKIEKVQEKTVEIGILSKSGWLHILEVRLRPQRQGERSWIFGIARDITELRRTEEELDLHRNHLEDLIRERTDALIRANASLNQEIIDRKWAEERLASEKKRLSVTLSSIAEGVISTDTSGRIVLINEIATTMTGFTREKACGMGIGSVLHLRDAQGKEVAARLLEEVLSGKKVLTLSRDLTLSGQDGSDIPVSISGSPIHDEGEKVAGAVVIFRDITGTLKYEEELRRQEKIRSIGTLAGGIAHDFNNMLAAVTGNLSIARMDVPEDSPAYAHLCDAEAAAFRARDVTQQLITFSKGGAPVKKTAEIGELVRETARFSLRGRKSTLCITIADDLCRVDVDTGQISQVIQNLIINADQAMPEGGTIEVKAENVLVQEENLPIGPGRYLRITVGDHGAGIPEEIRGRIFDPYFTTKKEGNGLGLASCQSIVRNHGGFIELQTEMGVGTAFKVYLPASQKAPEKPEEGACPADRLEKSASGMGKVLVMDDNEEIIRVAEALLRRRGFVVEGAADGLEAIDRYRAAQEGGAPFDVVVMDLTVPGGMGGKEAVQELLAYDPGLRAIVSSGYSDDPVMADYRSYGFVDVIAKPYRMADFIAVLKRHIRKSGD